MTGVIEGARDKVKDDGVVDNADDDGVADMVKGSEVSENVFCGREIAGGDADGVSSGVMDVGVEGKLK
jgi:hypothetical protein